MDEGGPRGRGELPKLFDIFDIFGFLFSREEVPESVPVQAVDAQGDSIVCNFCGMAIWNRHMHCKACKNFDLCLACFVFGRSCKHLTDYVLADLFPRKHLLGLYEGVKAMINTPRVCLEGTGELRLRILALEAVERRKETSVHMCHFCHEKQAVRKGIKCSKCSVFFCFRGLYRHFDIGLIAVLSNKDSWNCPKRLQKASGSGLQVKQPYKSKSKFLTPCARPVDTRGNNYFIFNGPNCPVGHGSLLAAMDATADWVLRWCRKIARDDIKSATVKSGAVSDYNVYTQEFHRHKTVWAGGCRSWYKSGGNSDGPVTAMYAGSVLHYKEILEEFRAEDFDIEYRSPDRFTFMGNGLTIRETTGGDLAYYVYK